MAYEQRELSGSLFKNTQKTEPNHSDYQGSCLIDGVEYWMSAWIKKGEKTWMSFAFKAKDKQEARKPEKQPSRVEEMKDDIPF